MKKYHHVEKISFNDGKMFLIVDGRQYSLQLSHISKKLANASRIEREKFEITPSGYGIHWQLIDEDLSIDGMLGIKHQPKQIKQEISV